ncbi:metallophosphoesterase [Ruminococcus sp.]|uniref:metallophosphoesterase family protein n=1 Tax=Ruminococcus sp. TaxID=41978 RepID=UPI0025D260F8|nr:metallophosphoesterase [Ruminococcus sp.]
MIYITGDIHGSLEPIFDLVEKYEPKEDDIIVILGDVAVNYTGRLRDKYIKEEMNNIGVTFFCIHGNHENRPQNIASYQEMNWNGGRVLFEEDYPNILFPVDGDIFELEGKRCIVIGGAYSVDKFYRLRNGYNWWPDEQPSPTIKEYVEEQIKKNKIDIVFSHTCPYKYIPTECYLSGIDQSKVDNSTEQWLDVIEDAIEYEAWYLGHWHTDKRIDKMHFLFHEVEIL